MKAKEFILQYLIGKKSGVDILNSEFVDAFIDATGASHSIMMWGANRCPLIGKTLSKMYKDGLLCRCRLSIADGYSGMPNWVYSYYLPITED